MQASGTLGLQLQGTYTGTDERRHYVVQIDSVTDPLIQATFRWSDSGGDTWNATNVLIVPNTWQALNNGIEVMFVPGAGNVYYVINDRWSGIYFRRHGPSHALDLNRSSELRTNALNSAAVLTLTMDLQSAQAPAALILEDHNIPVGSTIKLQASGASDFSALTLDATIPYAATQIRYEPTSPPTSRYWRVHITMGASVDYVRVSEAYLGGVLTMSKEFDIGCRLKERHIGPHDLEVLVRGLAPLGRKVPGYDLTFTGVKAGSGQDLEKLETLWDTIHDESARVKKPFWIYYDSISDLTFCALVHWDAEALDKDNMVLDYFRVAMPLTGVSRSAA